jgi:peptidoglycan/xylan/chitin deacetylase (PgdA/CDA1 family)
MMNFLTRAQKKLRYFFQPKAVVLCYHRIAEVAIDPWEIAVSPGNFRQHLQVLKKYKLFTASQLIERLQNQSLKKGMVCISFDDGYRDNYVIAKPLLQQYMCPSTFFIPVHYLGQQRQFWWDELQSVLLGAHSLPKHLSISINGEQFNFDLGNECNDDEKQRKKLTSWVGYHTPPSKRSELYIELWRRIKPLKYDDIVKIMNEIKTWSSAETNFSQLDLPMSVGELNDLIDDPLFEIGIHTVTHPALAFHDKQEQYKEIEGCRKRLEELGNKNTTTIAYPYGIYNQHSIDVTEEVGIKGGFTTENTAIKNGDHPLKLGRMHVKNWNGVQFEKNLSYWIKGFKF